MLSFLSRTLQSESYTVDDELTEPENAQDKMSFLTKFKRYRKGKLHIPQASSDNIQKISGPTDIKEICYVAIDDETGDFKGLPPTWEVLLESSQIRCDHCSIRSKYLFVFNISLSWK